MDDPVYRSGKGDMPSTAPDSFAGDSRESEVNGSQMGRTTPWGATVCIKLDERTMDSILDALTVRAGYEPWSSALNLARWDLKAVLADHTCLNALAEEWRAGYAAGREDA